MDDKISAEERQEDNVVSKWHILAFIIITFLIMIQGVLLITGTIDLELGVILILLLLVSMNSIWLHIRRRKRLSREEIREKDGFKDEIAELPKVYNFFCPHCLYQTNDNVKLCPNCKGGNLSPTTKYLDEQKS